MRVPRTVAVPAGEFLMGDDAGRDNERPARRVHVGAYRMAVVPVTRAEYAEFLAETDAERPAGWDDPDFHDPEQPVVGVSWLDADAYASRLAAVTGERWQLPSEAEWERAARGGVEGRTWPWGEFPPEDLPNAATLWSRSPAPVGRIGPNEFGICDLGTNVHEWCRDWYAADAYLAGSTRDPEGPEIGERRASRGGSWRHHRKGSRCAARSSLAPHLRYLDYGFRLVLRAAGR